MILTWTIEANQDRSNLFDFIAEQNIYAAVKLDDKIQESVNNLIHQPLMGVLREDRKARCLIVPDFDINVFYEVDEQKEKIVILKVMHQKQFLNPTFKFEK